jgi:hypothetical protein
MYSFFAVKMPPCWRHFYRMGVDKLLVSLLSLVLALLVSDAAAGLASGLARGLALAAAAVLGAVAQVAGFKSLDVLHDKFLRLDFNGYCYTVL